MKTKCTYTSNFFNYLGHIGVILLMASLISLLRNLDSWLTSDKAYNYGTLLTGLAAFIALLLAPSELRKWRLREKVKKSSEIAGKAAVNSIRFAEALRYIVNPIVLRQKKEGEDDLDATVADFNMRVEAANSDFNGFLESWSESEVFLTNEIKAAFNEFWKLWLDIRSSHGTWCACRRNGAEPVTITQYYTRVFGAETKSEITEKETKLKDLLTPLARLDSN